MIQSLDPTLVQKRQRGHGAPVKEGRPEPSRIQKCPIVRSLSLVVARCRSLSLTSLSMERSLAASSFESPMVKYGLH